MAASSIVVSALVLAISCLEFTRVGPMAAYAQASDQFIAEALSHHRDGSIVRVRLPENPAGLREVATTKGQWVTRCAQDYLGVEIVPAD